MPSSQALLDAVAQRLEAEPHAVLPTLRLLADPEASASAGDPQTMVLASALNADRLARRRAEFRAGSLDTSQVRQVLGGVSRQAVAQRARNGSLLAAEIAGRLYFPDWQFTTDGPHPRLRELLAALAGERRGALAADALMRRPLPEEAGRSPADLLAADGFETALHYVTAAGAGF